LSKLVSSPDFQRRLASIGSYSHAMTPDQALAFVKQQQDTWLPLLENAKEQ
jgi:tripartite-type tricarboxylate transporter receptor subunit TctC